MRYCNKCERDLADTFEECPFCTEPTEAKATQPPALSDEERRELKRAARKAQGRRLILFGTLLILVMVAVHLSSRRSVMPCRGEWFWSHYSPEAKSLFPDRAIVNSAEELEVLAKKHDLGPLKSLTIDFATRTLLLRSSVVESELDTCYWIESVHASPTGTFLSLAPSKPSSGALGSVEAIKARQDGKRAQCIQAYAVDKFDGSPTEEELTTSFSRLAMTK